MIVQKMLQNPIDKHCVLNVNIPAVKEELIKGIKICRQAYANWLTGKFVNFDKGKDTDVWALKNNYVSVVPVQFDLTNYVLKTQLEKTWKP